tara:strand:- start:952 stop:1185 length:234 start_codon:yes stop_codon:yes gene_type:complete
MKNLMVGDLVIGKETWWGRNSFLDRRFCNNIGVVSGVDHRCPDKFYYVTFPFGTYMLQIDDLVLISKKGAESLPQNS